MAHQVDYSSDGTRARVTLDLDNASLDPDASELGSQWAIIKNMLTHIRGVMPKRGAITNAGANSTNINSYATGASLAIYNGPTRSGNTYRPYIGTCVNASAAQQYVQDAASSRSSMGSASAQPTSKLPSIGGFLIHCGKLTNLSAGYDGKPMYAQLFAGRARGASYSTGTVTIAVGSSSVNGAGTTWTSAMEGQIFQVTSDTAAYKAGFYIVKTVVSATSILLDRPYGGDSAGAGKAYSIDDSTPMYTSSSSPFASSAGSNVTFKVAASAWGRLVVGFTIENLVAYSTSPEYRSRIRWSGTVGSSEGPNTGATGIFGFSTNGYIDLKDTYGAIVAIAPCRDYVAVFQDSGLTILRGAPVYDGAGSLDASEQYPNVFINDGFAFESTPDGVFFFDKQVGPCMYDGSSVQRLGDARVTRTMMSYGITAVGYYDGKVLFSGTTSPGIFVFDTRTTQWSFHLPPAIVSCLIAGRVENDEDIVGLGGGTRVVNLTNMFDNPGVSYNDWDGSTFIGEIQTGKIGSPLVYLRPQRVYVTYRLTDPGAADPYLTCVLQTGLPQNSDADDSWQCLSTDLTENVAVETRRLEPQIGSDPMLMVRITQNNAASKMELFSVVIDCAVEGEGAA